MALRFHWLSSFKHLQFLVLYFLFKIRHFVITLFYTSFIGKDIQLNDALDFYYKNDFNIDKITFINAYIKYYLNFKMNLVAYSLILL